MTARSDFEEGMRDALGARAWRERIDREIAAMGRYMRDEDHCMCGALMIEHYTADHAPISRADYHRALRLLEGGRC